MPNNTLSPEARAGAAAWLHWHSSYALRKFLPTSPEVWDRYYFTLGVAEFLSWLLAIELSFKAFRLIFKQEDYCKIHHLDKLFDQMGEEAQKELLATLNRVAPETTREDIEDVLRRYSNAFVELRYLDEKFSLISAEQFGPDRELLRNLCGACLSMLEAHGIKPDFI